MNTIFCNYPQNHPLFSISPSIMFHLASMLTKFAKARWLVHRKSTFGKSIFKTFYTAASKINKFTEDRNNP